MMVYIITKFYDSSFSQSEVKVGGEKFSLLTTQKRGPKTRPRIGLNVQRAQSRGSIVPPC